MADNTMKAVLEIGATIDRASLGAAFGKIRKEQEKLTDAIEDNKLEQKALNAQMKGLKKTSPELAKLRAQYDSVGDAIKRDEVAMLGLIREQRKLAKLPITPEIAKGPSAFERLSGGIRKVGAGVGSLARGAAITGTAIAGLGAAGFAAMTHVAEGMDETAKRARSLDVSTDALQELRYAAERSGFAAQDMDKAMASLQVKLSEGMATGGESGTAVEVMEILGLKLEDIYKLKPEKRLEAIADAMQDIKPSDRLALLAGLTDEESSKGLATLMEGGAQGLRDMRAEAAALGVVISKENLEAAEQFNDDLLNLKTAAFAALAPIAVDLMPSVINGLRGGLDWIQQNREAIGQFGLRLAEVIGVVGSWVGTGLQMVNVLSELQGGFDKVAETAALFFVAMKVGLLSNPFTAALFGLAMGVKAVYDNWDDLVIIWRDFVQPGIDGLVEDFKVFGDMIADLVPSLDTFKSAWDTVASVLPFTESGGTAPPTPRVSGGGVGPSQVTNNFNIAADLSEESVRRSHQQAAEQAARAAEQSAGYSMPSPGAI